MAEIAREQKRLLTKLVEITAVVERIPKNGHNDKQNYDYALESDIKDVVRKEMSDRGLVLISSELSRNKSELQGRNGVQQLVTLEVQFTIFDAETGESIQFTGFGDGQDFGDKALYKAKTGALKYALTTLFLIPTGDDPETEGKKPLQPPKTINEEQVKAVEDLIHTVASMSNSNPAQVLGQLKTESGFNKTINKMTEADFGIALQILQKWKKAYAKHLQNKTQPKQENINSIPWGQKQ
ncbi:ERF family protein [Enterococcus sp.]|uniref:ERF family protein n=1 Tax=Enterococcus sp. TaxID=35783 RepID=UPI002FCC000C